MTTSPDELDLIQRATSGDQEVFQTLLYRHYDMLARHVDRQIPGWMRRVVDVEDILQDTFAQAFRDIEGLRFNSRRLFASWLAKIATNRFHDKRKLLEAMKRPSARRVAQGSSPSVRALIDEVSEDGKTPSQIAACNERWQALQIAIASLPPDQQQAVRQYCLEQNSLEEVAASMQRTPASVRSLVHRAKQALREHMGRMSTWFSRR